MATVSVPAPISGGVASGNSATSRLWTPAYSLWRRELVRFYRQKARVVGVIASPLLFWLVLGSGFSKTFQSHGAASATSSHYLSYFFPRRDRDDRAVHGDLQHDVADSGPQ